jgi:glycopeptide antibiotics resistance protein
VTTFSKQIADMQNQVNMTNSQNRLAVESGGWFNWLLNLILLGAFGLLITTVVRKFLFKQTTAIGYGGPRFA